MKKSKSEKFEIQLDSNKLKDLKQLSKETKTSIDVLLEEALKDILKKYNVE